PPAPLRFQPQGPPTHLPPSHHQPPTTSTAAALVAAPRSTRPRLSRAHLSLPGPLHLHRVYAPNL
ncbi:hypothetical protein COCCADRAFT_86544, partial [Bipolaris zeicola 26-R-13]